VGEGEHDGDGNWLMLLLVRVSHRQTETIRSTRQIEFRNHKDARVK
jgi:hypothetical protein